MSLYILTNIVLKVLAKNLNYLDKGWHEQESSCVSVCIFCSPGIEIEVCWLSPPPSSCIFLLNHYTYCSWPHKKKKKIRGRVAREKEIDGQMQRKRERKGKKERKVKCLFTAAKQNKMPPLPPKVFFDAPLLSSACRFLYKVDLWHPLIFPLFTPLKRNVLLYYDQVLTILFIWSMNIDNILALFII